MTSQARPDQPTAHRPSQADPTPGAADGPRRLVVMDVDSTLIVDEVIELIAAHAGTASEVAEVTERAMRGELDFAESLRERVATLAGVPVSALDEVRAAVRLTPGAAELVDECHRRGWAVALVSGGFEEVVAPLARSLGITLFRANRLETSDGVLTGRTTGQVVDRAYKAQTLREFAELCEIPMEHTVAIGDGANDLDMIQAAAVGIAFAAKPVVREQAPFSVDGPRLDDVLTIIDAG